MSSIYLYENDGHKSILLQNFDAGAGIQANQHVIIHGKEAVILDPGGHKVYSSTAGVMIQSRFHAAKSARRAVGRQPVSASTLASSSAHRPLFA